MYRKTQVYLLFFITGIFLLSVPACVKIDEFPNTPRGNFEALWKIIDEHYCFFTYKEIDWDRVYEEYSPLIIENMSSYDLLNVLDNMLQELRDGHVNLVSEWTSVGYEGWYQGYAKIYNEDVIRINYLGSNYVETLGLKYNILPNNIGYIYCGSFSGWISENDLDEALISFSGCTGLILDVRNNTGGMLSNATALASRFTQEKRLVGYIQHKTGKGHDDFSTPYPKYVEPYSGLRYQKPVVVLADRQSYSATNEFVCAMKELPTVTIMGDTTGGGSGLPFSSELPCGWAVRFSACPNLDINMEHTEFGVAPDVVVNIHYTKWENDKDLVVETACKYIKNGSGNK